MERVLKRRSREKVSTDGIRFELYPGQGKKKALLCAFIEPEKAFGLWGGLRKLRIE